MAILVSWSVSFTLWFFAWWMLDRIRSTYPQIPLWNLTARYPKWRHLWSRRYCQNKQPLTPKIFWEAKKKVMEVYLINFLGELVWCSISEFVQADFQNIEMFPASSLSSVVIHISSIDSLNGAQTTEASLLLLGSSCGVSLLLLLELAFLRTEQERGKLSNVPCRQFVLFDCTTWV